MYLFLQLSDLLLSTENTIAIVCRHISQFQSTNIPESSSFLRVLTSKTTKNVTECKIESLEQPNIIFGFGAGGIYTLCTICTREICINLLRME